MTPADTENAKKLEGVWDFAHPNGQFEIELRSGGVFHCAAFGGHNHWTLNGSQVGLARRWQCTRGL